MASHPKLHSPALALGCALATCVASWAQSFDPGDSAADERLSSADLEELLAPVALYPDPLLANVLTASVYSNDIAAAAAYVASGRTVTESTDVDWEPSVKSVAMFPDVLKQLSEYPDWTAALGQAYLAQPEDVMSAVQALRGRARANDALRSTPEQDVVVENDAIAIEPTSPDVVYVPRYDPEIVYVERHERPVVPLISFGIGVAVGPVFRTVHCDWRRECVVWASRPPLHGGVVVVPGGRSGWWGRPWRPPAGRPRPIRPGWSRPWSGCSSGPVTRAMPGRPYGSRPTVREWRSTRSDFRTPGPMPRSLPPYARRQSGFGQRPPRSSQPSFFPERLDERPAVRPSRPSFGRPDGSRRSPRPPSVRPDLREGRPERTQEARPTPGRRPNPRSVRPFGGDRPDRPTTVRPSRGDRPERSPGVAPGRGQRPSPSAPPRIGRPRSEASGGSATIPRGGVGRSPGRFPGGFDRPERDTPRLRGERGGRRR